MNEFCALPTLHATSSCAVVLATDFAAATMRSADMDPCTAAFAASHRLSVAIATWSTQKRTKHVTKTKTIVVNQKPHAFFALATRLDDHCAFCQTPLVQREITLPTQP
jgi:hypothetical protein